MSRFSFSSSLALFQSVSAIDSDATSSSTNSSSAINNSSSSLSLSPLSSGTASHNPQQHHQQTQSPPASNIAALLFDKQIREPNKFSSIKLQQNNISTHLLELQREIKEEEEEIFADINSLINNRSNLYSSSFDDDTTDDFDDNIGGGSLNTTNTTTLCHNFSITKNSSKNNSDVGHQSDYFHEDEDQGLGHEPDLIGDENSTQNHHFLNDTEINGNNNNIDGINGHKQYYGDHSSYVPCNRVNGEQQHSNERSGRDQQQYLELEDENKDEQQQHLRQDDEQEQQQLDDYHQAIQREDIQQLTSNLPKPCVFFLEGNCRRSDCKYSHDLSSITCKYWIEGFCFKGEMCPFLHSFNHKNQDTSLLDDDLSLSKEKLNPTFAIESEADFPSLPLDAPNVILSADSNKVSDSDSLTKTIKNQILSSNPAVVFKTTKKKRKKG